MNKQSSDSESRLHFFLALGSGKKHAKHRSPKSINLLCHKCQLIWDVVFRWKIDSCEGCREGSCGYCAADGLFTDDFRRRLEVINCWNELRRLPTVTTLFLSVCGRELYTMRAFPQLSVTS
ncbi:hypothetical protein ARMSODRAFT_103664 [Armillaria solidipes]|uniref:Uncharacterized protein n=1 Tax=Armillaria solidipes TaxID=1076256 RepID=A0A2H3AI60_9AGAR|nr:hypothetical protein ARMSODRAFT_103664 [Armillaria solidipes]